MTIANGSQGVEEDDSKRRGAALLVRLAGGHRSAERQGSADLAGIASAAMEQMYAARSAFKDDANHAIVVITALLAGTGFLFLQGIMPIADAQGGAFGWRFLSLAMAFTSGLLVMRTSMIYMEKLGAGYALYSAAAVHATATWLSAGLSPTHTWQLDAIECAEKSAVFFSGERARGNWGAGILAVVREESAQAGGSTESFSQEIAEARENYSFVRSWGGAGGKVERLSTSEQGYEDSRYEPRLAQDASEVAAIWASTPETLLAFHVTSLRRVVCVALGFCVVTGVVFGLEVTASFEAPVASRRSPSWTALAVSAVFALSALRVSVWVGRRAIAHLLADMRNWKFIGSLIRLWDCVGRNPRSAGDQAGSQ